MQNVDSKLRHLANLALQAPESPPEEMPPGFDARVVACATRIAAHRERLAWERLAPRSVGLAAVACMVAILIGMRLRDVEDVSEIAIATTIVESVICP